MESPHSRDLLLQQSSFTWYKHVHRTTRSPSARGGPSILRPAGSGNASTSTASPSASLTRQLSDGTPQWRSYSPLTRQMSAPLTPIPASPIDSHPARNRGLHALDLSPSPVRAQAPPASPATLERTTLEVHIEAQNEMLPQHEAPNLVTVQAIEQLAQTEAVPREQAIHQHNTTDNALSERNPKAEAGCTTATDAALTAAAVRLAVMAAQQLSRTSLDFDAASDGGLSADVLSEAASTLSKLANTLRGAEDADTSGPLSEVITEASSVFEKKTKVRKQRLSPVDETAYATRDTSSDLNSYFVGAADEEERKRYELSVLQERVGAKHLNDPKAVAADADNKDFRFGIPLSKSPRSPCSTSRESSQSMSNLQKVATWQAWKQFETVEIDTTFKRGQGEFAPRCRDRDNSPLTPASAKTEDEVYRRCSAPATQKHLGGSKRPSAYDRNGDPTSSSALDLADWASQLRCPTSLFTGQTSTSSSSYAPARRRSSPARSPEKDAWRMKMPADVATVEGAITAERSNSPTFERRSHHTNLAGQTTDIDFLHRKGVGQFSPRTSHRTIVIDFGDEPASPSRPPKGSKQDAADNKGGIQSQQGEAVTASFAKTLRHGSDKRGPGKLSFQDAQQQQRYRFAQGRADSPEKAVNRAVSDCSTVVGDISGISGSSTSASAVSVSGGVRNLARSVSTQLGTLAPGIRGPARPRPKSPDQPRPTIGKAASVSCSRIAFR